MAKNYQVCDIRPSTGMSRGQSNEHLRNFSQRAYEEKRTGNFDPTREHLNFEIGKGGVVIPVQKDKPIDKRIQQNIDARGIKNPNEGLEENDPKRRRIIADFILQGSREAMRKLAFGDQELDEGEYGREPDNSHIVRKPEIEKWAKDMYLYMCSKFGEENIPAFVVHLDEKNPHIHCTVLSIGMIKGKERFSWKSRFGDGKYEASAFFKSVHDELSEVNKKYGLERGRSTRETGAKHRTNEEYWKWLTEKCSKLEEEKFGKEKSMRLLDDEISKGEKKIKSFRTMISNLSDTILNLEGEIGEKEMDLDERKADYQHKVEEINKLKGELSEAKAKLEQRQQQLRETIENLEKLKAEQEQIKKKIEDSKEELKSIQTMTVNAIATMSKSHGWDIAAEEIQENNFFSKEYRNNLSPEGKGWFDKFFNECIDGSFIEDIAERSNEIIACASSLFLGYLDQATRIAEGGGGGGGVQGALNGWGRRKDEDEWQFLGRCFSQARSMCRPASRGRRR